MEKTEEKLNNLERSVFVVGLLVLMALIGYLSYKWATKVNEPPHLEISISREEVQNNNTYRIETRNRGKETAKSVNIKFDLHRKGEKVQTAVLEIVYVPVQSKEIGWISFPGNPTALDSVSVSTITYLRP